VLFRSLASKWAQARDPPSNLSRCCARSLVARARILTAMQKDGSYQPEAERSYTQVTLDEAKRMRVNGESKKQMEHVHNLKKLETNTSVDEPWVVDPSLKWRDNYVLGTSLLWIMPKYIVFAPILFILQLPFMLVLRIYVSGLPTPCDTPNRNSCGYKIFVVAATIVGLPMLLVSRLAYILDCLFYYIFGILFCTTTCGWRSYCKSVEHLKPYSSGPWTMFAWSDVITGIIGQVWRHGTFEANVMLMNMWLLIPWAKYYINCNPWTHPLEPRMIQQISTSMQDINLADICKGGLQIMSRTKQDPEMQHDIDKWKFSPHYPYPPPWKRWTIGIQAGGNKIPAVFFLLTHTTHALCKHCGSTEQFVLSNSVAGAGYRVMLWYNNPYHFFTGWVEASITDGQPSQPEKNRGGEHPMWLVTSRSPLLSDRKSKTGTGWIDNFFDKWLPTIVDEIRKINRGDGVAKDLHEEVISKDGASRPAQGKNVPLVEAGTPADAMFEVQNLPHRAGALRVRVVQSTKPEPRVNVA